MPGQPNPPDPTPAQYRLPSFQDKAALARLAVIGVVVLAAATAFAGVGGWFSPHRLTPARIVNTFEKVNGQHPGFRRNHAKGLCVTGTFAGNGQGEHLSKAVVFQQGIVPMMGRLSLAGGVPDMPDGPKAVRSMALSFRLPDGEEWRTGMIVLPVFPFKDPKAFYEQLAASKPDPATGKPDPAKMKEFAAHNPETVAALKIITSKPFSTGFENASFNGLNAFRFVNAEGVATPVRWSMVASEPFAPEAPDQAASADKNYLFDALITRLGQGPVTWHLILTVGQPGDPTNDATIPWPADRPQIDAGTLTVDHAESEAAGNCRDINYDPLVLPDGIEASDDPLLSARSAAYAQSFTRRAGEDKQPSAVQVNAAQTNPATPAQ